MTSKKYTKTALTAAVLGTLLGGGSVFAQTPAPTNTQPHGKGEMKEMRQEMKENRKEVKEIKQEIKELPTVAGTVIAINSSSLTISGATAPKMATSTFSVIATPSTTVLKNKATTTISKISVGDKVAVLGTLSGTTVTASSIMIDPSVQGIIKEMKNNDKKEILSLMQGANVPLVGGSISAVSGETFTMINKGGTSYTVNASEAKVAKGGQGTTTVSTLKVGDMVMVQGVVNGTAITANSIILQPAKALEKEMKRATAPQAVSLMSTDAPQEGKQNFLERLEGFFKGFSF
jgi:hypothetical protein